jgi:hypothetical protein
MKSNCLSSLAVIALALTLTGSGAAHDLFPHHKKVVLSADVAREAHHGRIVRNASDCPVTPIRRAFRSKVTLECPAR